MASLLHDLASQIQHPDSSYVTVALTLLGLGYVLKQTWSLLSNFLNIFVLSGKSVSLFCKNFWLRG